MKRFVLNDTDQYQIIRFKQPTEAQRHEAWLQHRRQGVGGSDMSAILGLNKYTTPYQLWLDKTGRTKHEELDNWAIVKGRTLEPALRKRFKRMHPEYLVQDGTDKSFTSRAHPCMQASLDGIIYDTEHDQYGVLEIKTANAVRGAHDWHDSDGELTAPDYYVAQVTHYMAVTGFSFAVFYADIGEREPVEVRVERDEQDIQTVIHAAEQFWQFVQDDTMPALQTASEVSMMYPQSDGDEISAPAEQASEITQTAILYQQVSEQISELKDKQEALKDQLAVAVGEHDAINTGQYRISYKTTMRKARTVPEHTIPASTYRVLRVKEVQE